jgi:hypothetical protein
MKHHHDFTQVSRVINIMNSCENQMQLFSCKNLIENYINDLKFNGVVNHDDVRRCLYRKYNERSEVLQAKSTIKKMVNKKRITKKVLETMNA